MEVNYNGIVIEKTDKQEYIALSHKANIGREKEKIENEKNAYLKKQKEVKKFKIAAEKRKITDFVIMKKGNEQKIKALKAECKKEIEEEFKRLDSLSAPKYISLHVEAVEEEREINLNLLKHKYHINSDVYKKESNKIDTKANAKIISIKKYSVDETNLKSGKDAFKNSTEAKLQKNISLIEKQIEIKMKEIADQKVKFSEFKKKFKPQHREKVFNRKKDFKNEKHEAKVNAREARKEIVSSNVFLNSFYEPVIDESKEISKEKFVPSKSIKIDKNEEFYREKRQLETLKLKLEKQLFNNDDSFDSKAKIIELKYKIEYFGKILDKKKEYAKRIADQMSMTEKDKANLNKKDIDEKFKAAKEKILENKKIEILRIKDQYKKGVFSKSSKKNSIDLAKKTAKSDIREAKLKNPLLINSEKARFLKIEESRMISKLKTLMYSIIDDAVKNIPTKSIEKQRFLAAFMSLILPGTGQILNKQYVKGMLLLLLSAFVYGFLLPVAAGWISFKGDGINGLGTLSPSKDTFIGIAYEDARFRMIEGIVAMFAIVIGLASLILSSKDAYLFAKAKELGLRPKNSRDLKRYFKNSGLPYLLSLPAAIAILFIVLLPLVATILLGFTNYSTGHIPPGNPLNWAGFDNFKMVFTGDYAESFGFVAIWTIIWTVSVSFGVIALGTFLAFVVDQKRIKGKILFTTIFILPWAVPAFATILFFSAALDNGGIYQHLFNTKINFKNDASWTKGLLITIQIWLGHSYIFLLMMGVKKSISEDFYEAASIDGASKWGQFWKISAPIIMFQIAPLLIGQIVFNFNNYGIIWMFNDGGPASAQSLIGNPGSTDIFLSLIFKMTTDSASNRIALASAFTIVVSIGVVLISAIGFIRSKSFKGEM